MSPKAVLIVSCGALRKRLGLESFAEMFVNGGGLSGRPHEIVDVTRRRPPERLESYAAMVVTGSLAMVTGGQLWVERLTSLILEAFEKGLPTLGVCFGHQAMARALGGRVDYHPRFQAVGTFDIRLKPEARSRPETRDLPQSFAANLYHSQAVLEPPPGGVVLASHDHDPNCVIGYGPGQLGVQFHPEFDERIMGAFTRNLDPGRPVPAGPGRPPSRILWSPLRPTPVAASLLSGFLDRHSGGG